MNIYAGTSKKKKRAYVCVDSGLDVDPHPCLNDPETPRIFPLIASLAKVATPRMPPPISACTGSNAKVVMAIPAAARGAMDEYAARLLLPLLLSLQRYFLFSPLENWRGKHAARVADAGCWRPTR